MIAAEPHRRDPDEPDLRQAASRRPGVVIYISARDRDRRRPYVHLGYRAQGMDLGLGSFGSCGAAQQWLEQGGFR